MILDFFYCHYIASVGKSRGILCGIKMETWDTVSVRRGRYIMQLSVKHKTLNLELAVLVVYGAAHDEHKLEFLSEMSEFCNSIALPHVVI